MIQGSIDWPLHRNDDPATSRAAANAIRPHVRSLCQAAAELVKLRPGLTGYELDQVYRERNPDAPEGRLRKRLADAERLQLIRRGERRACGVTGNQAVTWWPPEQG